MSTSPAGPQLSPLGDTLASVGEVETLKRLFPRLPQAAAAQLGPGDDSAVVAAPDGRFVVTTDMMIHGPDFRLAWSTPHDLGWKAAVTNLADVAAMGAVPSALVVAIAAPLGTQVALLEGIADGLLDACGALAPDVGVVGGDLSVSNTLTLAITAFGDLEGRAPVTRSGARPGDIVAVAGSLGRAGAGIWLLFEQGQTPQEEQTVRGKKTAQEPSQTEQTEQAEQTIHTLPRDEEPAHLRETSLARQPDAKLGEALRREHPVIVTEQLAPTSPLAAGRGAALAGATSMLDVSDGLLLDAGRIATASQCSIDFSHAAIEAESEALRAVDSSIGGEARDFVLCGGEDHALLATFPLGVTLPAEFRAIGVVGEPVDGHPLVTVGGAQYLRPGGWDPFAGWNGATG